MAIGDFNKKKQLDVASVTGTPTISRTVCLKITDGDDSITHGSNDGALDVEDILSIYYDGSSYYQLTKGWA